MCGWKVGGWKVGGAAKVNSLTVPESSSSVPESILG